MFRSVILRFVLPPLLAAGVLAYFAVPYTDRVLADWFSSDVQLRARLVMSSMRETLPTLIESSDRAPLKRYVDRIVSDQHLLGLLVCRPDGRELIASEHFPRSVSCQSAASVPT